VADTTTDSAELRALALAVPHEQWKHIGDSAPYLVQIARPAQLIQCPSEEAAAFVAALSPEMVLVLLDRLAKVERELVILREVVIDIDGAYGRAVADNLEGMRREMEAAR